jgi:hypothetical protein
MKAIVLVALLTALLDACFAELDNDDAVPAQLVAQVAD